MTKLIIYGAGERGRGLLRLFRRIGVSVDCFCQTEAKSGLFVEGIPVISFAELLNMEGNLTIFIAIGDKNVGKNIRLRLSAIFLEQAEIIDCVDFLKSVKSIPGGGVYCLLCNSQFDKFTSGGFVDAKNMRLFKEHHIIGGGYRENWSCPVCGGIDRERWQLYVLSKYTGVFREKCRVLHFAPEAHISKFIAANPSCDYYTGDIAPCRAMHITNVLDIQYKDETFDYVIMNHVLEHIEDMSKALSEIKRVLKPTGKLILSFPICADQDTLELPNINTPEERLRYYGQEDHVRLFGRDYLQIIEQFGLDVTMYTPKDYCSRDEIMRYGFIEDDAIMVCGKV